MGRQVRLRLAVKGTSAEQRRTAIQWKKPFLAAING
jgi:hypothetical protein